MTKIKETTPDGPLLRDGKTYEEMKQEANKEKRGNTIYITATAIMIVVRVLLFVLFLYFGIHEMLFRKNQTPNWSLGKDNRTIVLLMNLSLETLGMIWNLYYYFYTLISNIRRGYCDAHNGDGTASCLFTLCLFYAILVFPFLTVGETSSRLIYGCYGLFSIVYYWLHWILIGMLEDRFEEGMKACQLRCFYDDGYWETYYCYGHPWGMY
ncbi:hypothetical protein CAEBREN_11334 [Caenorhabditis brenneri]|uniref:Uncharacterized protein n=1 Tax=Caenorhabditis brenneri TaxID=135651 RepID=G0MV32_CAEBE|nr:hypothetical protein CAEBREN_11334 [Caenorhabditis brenneri]